MVGEDGSRMFASGVLRFERLWVEAPPRAMYRGDPRVARDVMGEC
jgi:hypothetical protein